MVQQLNAKEVKSKILDFLNIHGPSLPVQVSRHMQMNTLFASAFLSELSSEGLVKISDMKVGGSPLYYTPHKTNMLENFSKYLNSKEREAFNLLKENKILRDETQHPAIRVALRDLKDFAIPFKKDDKIYWRYFTSDEKDIPETQIEKEETKEKNDKEPIKEMTEEEKPTFEPEKTLIQKEVEIAKQRKDEEQRVSDEELNRIKKELEERRKELDNMKSEMKALEEKNETTIKPEKKFKRIKSKKKPEDDSFLDEIKTSLAKKSIELIRLEHSDKKQVLAIVKINNQETLLAAYNKKKIEDKDLLKAYKKSLLLGIPYYLLCKGEPSKKTKETIDVYKRLTNIEILEKEENSEQNSE